MQSPTVELHVCWWWGQACYSIMINSSAKTSVSTAPKMHVQSRAKGWGALMPRKCFFFHHSLGRQAENWVLWSTGACSTSAIHWNNSRLHGCARRNFNFSLIPRSPNLLATVQHCLSVHNTMCWHESACECIAYDSTAPFTCSASSCALSSPTQGHICFHIWL